MPARIGCQALRPELVSTYCEIPLPLCIGSLDRKLQQRSGIAPFSEPLRLCTAMYTRDRSLQKAFAKDYGLWVSLRLP